MKTINLLPKEVKVKDTKGIIFNVVLILLAVVAVIMIAFSIILYDVNNYIVPRLDDYRKVNMQIGNYIAKLETYERFRDKVNNKSELVNSLKENEIFWSDILNDLGEKIPDNVYINYIDGNSKSLYEFIEKSPEEKEKDIKKVIIFSIGGYAVDYNDVAKFAIGIKDIPNTGEVIINNISRDQITESGIDVVSFNISTFYNLEPYLQESGDGGTVQLEESGEENLLDTEIEMIEQ